MWQLRLGDGGGRGGKRWQLAPHDLLPPLPPHETPATSCVAGGVWVRSMRVCWPRRHHHQGPAPHLSPRHGACERSFLHKPMGHGKKAGGLLWGEREAPFLASWEPFSLRLSVLVTNIVVVPDICVARPPKEKRKASQSGKKGSDPTSSAAPPKAREGVILLCGARRWPRVCVNRKDRISNEVSCWWRQGTSGGITIRSFLLSRVFLHGHVQGHVLTLILLQPAVSPIYSSHPSLYSLLQH